MIWQRIAVLTCLCAMLAACPEEATDLGAHSRHSHPNGLTIAAPEALAVTRTARGFRLSPAAPLRSVGDTLVVLHEAAPAPATMIETRSTKAGMVAYTLRKFEGGSGGAEYELRAWRPLGGQWIVLTALRQSEWGEPEFPYAWRLLETAELR